MLGLMIFLCPVTLAIAQAPPEPAQVILHLLDYVAVDYPQCVQDGTVLDQSEYDEQVEFSQQVRTPLDQLPAHSARSSLRSQTEQLIALIQDKRPGSEVSALAHQLRWYIIRAYNVEVAPKRPPDLRMAVELYRPNALPATVSRATAMDLQAPILTQYRATSMIGSAWISAVTTACTAPLPWASRAQQWRASAR
jgi:hypothetical protein